SKRGERAVRGSAIHEPCCGALPESTAASRISCILALVDPAKREILRRVRVFADLGDEDCDAVLAVLKARRGAPGDALFKEGDRGDSLMIVLDGLLVARARAAGGAEQEIARLG